MTIAFIPRKFIQNVWSSDFFTAYLPILYFLLPLSWIYIFFIRLRFFLYDVGFFAITKIDVPVIVVGNIVVGGSGKTPLVIWLAKHYKAKGLSPGIVSRGYGGTYTSDIKVVKPTSDPVLVGDEPVLIARNSNCPVVVGKERIMAAKELVERHECDIILSDDGIQHYALARDIELVVIDGESPFGNGYCLPAGPCREPKLRPFYDADIIITTYREGDGISDEDLENKLMMAYAKSGITYKPWFIMRYIYKELEAVGSSTKTATLSDLQGKTIHAIAGIHNPTHFFSYLRNHNVNLITHQFPDHHIFTEKDIKFDDNLPVVMTEKDAVKCLDFTVDKHWYLPISVELPHFTDKLDAFMRNEYAADKMQVEMGKNFKRWRKNRPWKRKDG